MKEHIFDAEFSMRDYLTKRALEIESPQERKLFKEIVEKMLLQLYEYTQTEFHALEERIFDEMHSVQGDYAISIGVVDRAHYDSTDTFLQPMCAEDTQPPKYAADTLLMCMKEENPYPIAAVFLEADEKTVQKFASEKRTYQGTISTDCGTYQAVCTVRKNTKYLKQAQSLYRIFNINYLPWTTICTAYLRKFFDVEIVSAEEFDKKEEIREIRVDFEEYETIIRREMLPLWNLVPMIEKTNTYPEPCVNKVNFEHRIFSHRLDAKCQYLVTNLETTLTNIRRVRGDLILTCTDENPQEWLLYRVNPPSAQMTMQYPILSNFSGETFAGNLSERYRRSVKTRAEIARVLSAYGYQEYVRFQDVILDTSGEESGQTYYMDEFLTDELRTKQSGIHMVLTFTSEQPDFFLTLDIMSFLVTQIQGIFPEYVCIGKLV